MNDYDYEYIDGHLYTETDTKMNQVVRDTFDQLKYEDFDGRDIEEYLMWKVKQMIKKYR